MTTQDTYSITVYTETDKHYINDLSQQQAKDIIRKVNNTPNATYQLFKVDNPDSTTSSLTEISSF